MILLGKPVAQSIYTDIKKDIENLKARGIAPFLAVILVGNDPASLTYVKLKEKVAKNLGIGFKLYHLPQDISQEELAKFVGDLNCNKFITGIIIQLPLPEGIETDKIIALIDPDKDIDGFSGKFPVPTAQAILSILVYYDIDLTDKKVLLVGHGRLVGQPIEKILVEKGIKPSVATSETKNLAESASLADIIISGVGKPDLITADMVKDGMIVIDAGTAEEGGQLVGDVNEKVYEKNVTYTPTPGGVGPVTVASLMKNLVTAAKK